eukprot:6946894-Pyramimonas_sp.AAC.1
MPSLLSFLAPPPAPSRASSPGPAEGAASPRARPASRLSGGRGRRPRRAAPRLAALPVLPRASALQLCSGASRCSPPCALWRGTALFAHFP